ncbi:hypothetical protein EC991_005124 [Linnemannia zychae]|nr:hypothetical protein EC991_005124 [Linnemannia zychae]
MADSSYPPPPMSLPSAMARALDISEISFLIRQDLQGYHLKSAVLVCKLWWRMFAPYLWERVFIDTDLSQQDCEVLVRNGLAARSLTLSIYDPLDAKGIVAYVAERCRNVTALHLKLFTPDLVTIDHRAKDHRLKELWALDVEGHSGDNDNTDLTRQFGIQSECKTELLDSLLSKLPWVSELTLSLAHEDLRPEVLWCVPTLTRLRKLTVLGGLPTMEYMVHKNRQCNWDLLLRVGRECKYLNSLVVSWEAHKLDNGMDQHILKMAEMFEALETPSAPEPTQHPTVPLNEQFKSLRSLSVFLCELHAFQMDFFYRSCPNLRAVEFKSVQAKPIIMEKNLASLARSCPNLLSFKHLGTNYKGERINYSNTLLAAPTSNIHSLTLSLAEYDRLSLFGNDRLSLLGNDPEKNEETWTVPAAVTSLNIRDVRKASVILDAITTVPGLSHLTIDGPLFRLPTFASQESLVHLDISTLDITDCRKLFKILFRRIQELKRLKFFKMARQHVIAANLHLTWSDDTLVGSVRKSRAPLAVATTTTTIAEVTEQLTPGVLEENIELAAQEENVDLAALEENIDLNALLEYQDHDGNIHHHHHNNNNNNNNNYDTSEASEPMAETDDERVFTWFPTVEHLYLVEMDTYTRFRKREPFLKFHQASALVRMMPQLKAMSFNREDAKFGLERIIEACPKISFNFVLRQK